MMFQFCVQILVCLSFALGLPGTTAFQSQDLTNLATRQNDLSVFKDVKCNRAAWKKLVRPFLLAQGAASRHPGNFTLQNAYMASLGLITAWKSDKQNQQERFDALCNVFQFAECDENSNCVCGQGRAPYHFEQTPGDSVCLAKRGSICVEDKLCADGLKCQNLYCGGTEAFVEENDKSFVEESDEDSMEEIEGAAAYKSISFILYVIVPAVYFI